MLSEKSISLIKKYSITVTFYYHKEEFVVKSFYGDKQFMHHNQDVFIAMNDTIAELADYWEIE